MPVLKDKSVFIDNPVYSPGGEILKLNLVIYGPTINTRLVKPQDEPKSYNELLEPKWKGRMSVGDPGALGTAVIFYAPLYHKGLDIDYWRRFSLQNVNIYMGSVVEQLREVARGEYALTLSGLADTVAPLIQEGAPVKMLTMEEGHVVGSNVIAAVKDGAHPNAAKLFLNWLLTKEGQIAYVEPSRNTPFRKDVPDFAIAGTQIKAKKWWPRSWEFEDWAIQEMKRGTVAQFFGRK